MRPHTLVAGLLFLALSRHSCKPEVGDSQVAVSVDEDVVGLQVPMKEISRLRDIDTGGDNMTNTPFWARYKFLFAFVCVMSESGPERWLKKIEITMIAEVRYVVTGA